MAVTFASARSLRRGEATMAASFIGAFIECSHAVQEVVKEMIAIVNSDDSDPEECDAALNTIAEALFPLRAAAICAAEEKFILTEEFAEAAIAGMREQEEFAERVRNIMREMSITQERLASLVGITQPAVSNILSRNARPQRRTISRFAEALNVAPESLWPEFKASGDD